MAEMTSRERVRMALNHREPDRVPVDICSNPCTQIHIKPYIDLLRLLKIKNAEEPLLRKTPQTVAHMDYEALKKLGGDLVGVMTGLPDKSPGKTLEDGTWIDEFGVHRRMPENGLCYDLIHSPLTDHHDIETMLEYPLPDPDDPGLYRGVKERVDYLYNQADYAIFGFSYYFCMVHLAQYLRGYQNWFLDFVENPDYAHQLHEKCCDFICAVANNFLEIVGDYIDVIFYGDDIASQDGLMISPATFREFIKPRWKRVFDLYKSKTKAKIFLHSCGNIAPLIEDIIEIGVEILNPIQACHADMDTKILKEKYGDRLSFWGAVDTQKILNLGTVADVEREVKKRIDDLARSGGYVAGPVHAIMADVPAENVIALYKTARDYGRYL